MVAMSGLISPAFSSHHGPPRVEEELFADWLPFSSPMKIPSVIDMRQGGEVDVVMSEFSHRFEGGFEGSTKMYGYSLIGEDPTFPGPTIRTQKGVPVSITWHNSLSAPHILDRHIERDLLFHPSSCYPVCGVPAITHIHGMEVPPSSDGVPYQSIYGNESRTDVYPNSQMSSTHVYHDHAMGLTRLNHWSGLVGGYIIEDSETEKNLLPSFDIPIIITDTMIDKSGNLLYPDSPCNPVLPSQRTKWAPEAFGSVNVVNGVVLPYIEVPQQSVRLRLVNGANSRNFGLNISFFTLCTVIAKDMSLVNIPYKLSASDEVLLYPLERIDLLCDFSDISSGTTYNVTDWSYTSENSQSFDGIFQVRITPTTDSSDVHITPPQQLNSIKNLPRSYESNPGAERHFQLDEEVDKDDCPLKLVIKAEGEVSSFEERDSVNCVKGDIEKWVFRNPTADVHPIHFHAISVQCGANESSVDTNSLKDTVQIPNMEGDAETVTQVCYVACTPNDYLLEGSTSSPSEFSFPTLEPYVMHCHMLEHEENAMMTYFFLADKEGTD